MDHNALIDRLLQLVAAVPNQLIQASWRDLEAKSSPEKWSGKEIFGHLIDSARYNLERFTMAPLTADAYQVVNYPQADLVRINGYQNLPVAHLLSLWAGLNAQIAEVWRQYAPADLEKEVLIPDRDATQRVDLHWLMQDYLQHMEHHLRQLPLVSAEETAPAWQLLVASAARQLAGDPQGRRFIELASWGKLEVEYYAPRGKDLQRPHDRDEVYVVISGTGVFVNAAKLVYFRPGDVLFVPARQEHRFVEFSEDFATWVLFVAG